MIDGALLRAFDVFRSCSDEDLEHFLSLVRILEVPSGHIICHQAEAGRTCYFILKGTVLVYRRLAGNRRFHYAPLLPGAIFGQVSLIDGRPRIATCEALGPARLLEISPEAFLQLQNAGSELTVAFQLEVARALVRQLRIANQRLGELEDQPDTTQAHGLEQVLRGMGIS